MKKIIGVSILAFVFVAGLVCFFHKEDGRTDNQDKTRQVQNEVSSEEREETTSEGNVKEETTSERNVKEETTSEGNVEEETTSESNVEKETELKEFSGQWLDDSKKEKTDSNFLGNAVEITEIYSNCFFAKTDAINPYIIKFNGQLLDQWCVGDKVEVEYDNVFCQEEEKKAEADFISITISGDISENEFVCYKPVIYLYPEYKMDVNVSLELNGMLTCTYPLYSNGWKVKASPNGSLTDANGKIYNYLYWEGDINAEYDFSKGFCIKGQDTAIFLENALEKLGLNRREANEFIVYWLPLMEQNEYNVISFQTDNYTENAELKVNPAPDTMIRVFMTWKASNNYIEIEEQELTAPERKGFTVVEWGGTECE